jgi:hypothetical protein
MIWLLISLFLGAYFSSPIKSTSEEVISRAKVILAELAHDARKTNKGLKK